MKKPTIRKSISILLSLLLALSVFGGMTFTAGAASDGTCGSGLTWTLDDDGLLTISGTGTIADFAFKRNEAIKTVVIESGVTGIGYHAFRECSGLTSVTISDSVTEIKDQAFNGCTGLTSVSFGTGVSRIGDFAFYETGLTAVVIPASVTTIGDFAFCETGLTAVVIPASVTTIGGYAFYNCTGLAHVFYNGSAEDWSGISIGNFNESLTGANLHFDPVVVSVSTATCTEDGVNLIWSDDYELIMEVIPATGHAYVNHEAQAPTCTEIGWDAYQTCENCDYTTYEEIPATGHIDGDPVAENVVEATCTEDGSYEVVTYCSVCGEELHRVPKTQKAFGHMTELVNAKEATATEDGYTGDEVCTVCGETITAGEVIPATGEPEVQNGSNDFFVKIFNWLTELFQMFTRWIQK